MLLAVCLALLGGLVARYFRASLLLAVSGLVVASGLARWLAFEAPAVSSLLLSLAYLCSLQGGYLIGSVLMSRGDSD